MVARVLGAVLFVLSGVLWALNARIVAGRLGPNGWVGIRTAATRESSAAWMAAHRAASPLLKVTAVVGWATALAAIVYRSRGILLGGSLVMALMSGVAKLVGVRAVRVPTE